MIQASHIQVGATQTLKTGEKTFPAAVKLMEQIFLAFSHRLD